MSAIGRFLRAWWYRITGRVDRATDVLNTDPNVIRATFDNAIATKKSNINQYQEAIAGKIVQREEKVAKLKELTADVQKLEKLKQGATLLAKKIVEKHNGDKAATAADPEYIRCQTAFKDYSSTLDEKNERIKELTTDVERISTEVEGHKNQINTLLRDLDNVKGEKNDTIADILGAKQEKNLNDMLNGLSEDRTGEELAKMRQLRSQAKASATVGRELSGLGAKKDESEFMAQIEQQQTNSEFDELMGFAAPTPAAADADDLEKTINAELDKAKSEQRTPEAATSN